MTGETGQRSALTKARRLAQIRTLMTRAPGIAPVLLLSCLRRLAMTGPAKFIQLDRIQLSWIPDGFRSTVMDVAGAWSVTCFTANTGLAGFDAESGIQCKLPRRVAAEAPQDRGLGIERRKLQIFGSLCPGVGAIDLPEA